MFGINLVELPPGCWSAQRHWHSHEGEFLYLLEGALTPVPDAGGQVLRAGMAAGFAGRSAGDGAPNERAPATTEQRFLSVAFFPLIGYTVVTVGCAPLAITSAEPAELRA